MFDVNLRQDFFTADLIRQSCALATVVKLNEQELPRVHRCSSASERRADDAATARPSSSASGSASTRSS